MLYGIHTFMLLQQMLILAQTYPPLVGALWTTIGVMATIMITMVGFFLIHFNTVTRRVDKLFVDVAVIKRDLSWIRSRLENGNLDSANGENHD